VFNKFFGTSLGIMLVLGCSLVWMTILLWGVKKTAEHRDFLIILGGKPSS
jgi:hypothetical protein